MYVRGLATILLTLCACDEAPVPAPRERDEAPADPWAVRVEAGSPPRLRFTEGPALALPERIGVDTKEWRHRVVVVSRAGIGFAGVEVLGLADGRIPAGEVKGPVVPRLVEAYGPMKAGSTLTLLADRRLPFGELELVMSSALRAGASRWSFAVRRPEDAIGTATGSLQVHPMGWDDPLRHVGGSRDAWSLAQHSFVLALMITGETLEFGEIRHTGAFDRLARFTREEGYEPVRRFARELARRIEPMEDMPAVVFGVDPEVPLERVIAALVSVGGSSDCDPLLSGEERGECWVPVPYLDRHARSLWDLAAPDPGELIVTLAASEQRRRPGRVDTRIPVSGEACSVELEPGQVVATWWSNSAPVRLIVHDDGRQRLSVDVVGARIEVDSAACATFSAKVTRHDVAGTDAVVLRGFLDVDCALGEVVRLGETYRAAVLGRVHFSPCG